MINSPTDCVPDVENVVEGDGHVIVSGPVDEIEVEVVKILRCVEDAVSFGADVSFLGSVGSLWLTR